MSMSFFSHNYLATYRKRWGLSQRQLAYLLGWDSASSVSRFESMGRLPNLMTALKIEALFESGSGDLFPGLYRRAEIEVADRAKVLYRELEGRTDPKSQEALALLAYIIRRS